MENAEQYVSRWTTAGLIDESTAAAIRAYESERAKHGGRQWQVILVLILGAMLLGAGVLLFVAAHWDKLSPVSRMFLVLAMLVFFHGLGLLFKEKFGGLATAMHAVGTVSAGAAIALIGQIFNMQEHWPAAVLLWALCAAAGWLLLRDQFQQTLTLLLVPAWIVSEWSERTSFYASSNVYLARMLLVIAVVYLCAFLYSKQTVVFGILAPIGVGWLSEGWFSFAPYTLHPDFAPLSYRLAALVIVFLAIAFGTVANAKSFPPACVAACLAYALPWAQKTEPRSEPNLFAYAMVAAAAVFLVWWGVHTSAKSLVNYGMVAFAATVMWFYFSSVMDKLGRSLGLITLGILFLAGGWLLERTRRRLIGGMAAGAA
jgi:uncharacterized membrane protein